jgi:hypothetical protein
MEVFSELGLLDAELSKVNLCWLHRQVLTISDIADGSGERITMNAWKGTQSVPHTNRYKWGSTVTAGNILDGMATFSCTPMWTGQTVTSTAQTMDGGSV